MPIGGEFVAGEGPPEAILNRAAGEPIARDAAWRREAVRLR
jgi:hypothetical protein